MTRMDGAQNFAPQVIELAKLEENNHCVECGSPNPRWASHTLGLFLCMRCAGLHRSIGVHVSRVKSLTLDNWNKSHYEFMKSKGNQVSKAYFEAKLGPDYPRPKDDRSLLEFIKRKYEFKKFVSSTVSYENFTLNAKSGSSKPLEQTSSSGTKTAHLSLRASSLEPRKDELVDLFSQSLPQTSQATTHQNSDLFSLFQQPAVATTPQVTNDFFGLRPEPPSTNDSQFPFNADQPPPTAQPGGWPSRPQASNSSAPSYLFDRLSLGSDSWVSATPSSRPQQTQPTKSNTCVNPLDSQTSVFDSNPAPTPNPPSNLESLFSGPQFNSQYNAKKPF